MPASIHHLVALAILSTVLIWSSTSWSEEQGQDDFMVRHSVESDFESVVDNLRWAITNQGLVISTESHIDEMLKRTGKDLGISEDVYGHAVAFEFCSANFSRQMMAADPHNIVFCPFVISVYNLPSDLETVYVAYRKPQRETGSDESDAALAQVAELLESIAVEATE